MTNNNQPGVQFVAQPFGNTVMFNAPLFGMIGFQITLDAIHTEADEQNKELTIEQDKLVTMVLVTGSELELDATDSAYFLDWWKELTDPSKLVKPALVEPPRIPRAHNFK